MKGTEKNKGWMVYDQKLPSVRVYHKMNGTMRFKIGQWSSAEHKYRYKTMDLPTGMASKSEILNWLKVEQGKLADRVSKGQSEMSSKMLFSEYFEDYFIEKRDVRNKTREEYLRQYESYIKRYIGNMRLDEITIESLNEFMRDASEEISSKHRRSGRQYSGHSCCNAMLRLIKAVLNQAMEDSLIDRNPAMSQRIRLLSGDEQKRALTDEEFRAFLYADETPYWNTLIWVMASTGCRRSEIAGLTWDNVHLGELPHISVVQSVSSITGKGVEINAPKTKKSWRHIPIPAALVEKLNGYRDQCISDIYLFPSFKDPSVPISPDSITAHIRELGEKMGFENVSPHMFRSYAATKMICSGANEMMVRKITGHTNPDTIENYYLKMDHEEGLSVVKHILDK